MTDESALLAAIKQFPDEDTPRLVYADWLQEQGREDRAQLIRYQCAPRVLPVMSAPWAATTRVQRKEKTQLVEAKRTQKSLLELIVTQTARLLGEWHGRGKLHWERGFIAQVNCSWRMWRGIAESLRAAEWVPRVYLTSEPAWETKTASAMLAPAGWCVGYVLGKTCWDWESLGKPEIGPHDNAALAKCLCEAEWPGTEFVAPDFGISDLRGAFAAVGMTMSAAHAHSLAGIPLPPPSGVG